MSLTQPDVVRVHLTDELEQIFRDHYQLVYRTAYGVTASRDDAQDVLQTIFLRLLGRALPPDLQTNPKAYLYRAAVNLSLNTVRNRRRHVLMDVAKGFEHVAQPDSPDSIEDLHRRLYAAIAELQPDAAHMLILRYVHGSSIAEIARMLGKPRSLIAVRLFRTRARLKQLICASQGVER